MEGDAGQMEGPSLGDEAQRKVSEVRARHEEELLRYPNVVGVATGVKSTGGRPTGEPCLVVYVEKKVAEEDLDRDQRLPAEVEGVPLDVVEVGRIEPLPA
jgi:hypothetical protein